MCGGLLLIGGVVQGKAGEVRYGLVLSVRVWRDKPGRGRLGAVRYVREMSGTSRRGKAGMALLCPVWSGAVEFAGVKRCVAGTVRYGLF